VHGKTRYRMHGGAKGSGALKASQNARKHGLFTRDAIAERTEIRALLGEVRKLLEGMTRLDTMTVPLMPSRNGPRAAFARGGGRRPELVCGPEEHCGF